MTKISTEIELIKKDLFAADHAKVVSALKRTRELGNHSLIEPLLTLFLNEKDELVRSEIKDMLSTLKISKAQSELETALVNPLFKPIRADILSFLWNSGMNPKKSTLAIAQAAVDGDFLTALEALTLMESMTGVLDEAQVMEATILLRHALEDKKNADKQDLLRSLFQLLLNNRNVED